MARAEAERRVREAALARKRAREALDNLAILVHTRGDKAVRKEGGGVEGSAEVCGSGNVVIRQKEKSPLAQNSQPKMFNGFDSGGGGAPPRQNPVMPIEKNENGELKPVVDHHRPSLQTNGNNLYDNKPGNMEVEKEKVVKLEPKI